MVIKTKGQESEKYVDRLDFLIYGISVLGCFLLFSHTDLMVTAQNASMYLDGHWKDFYTSCYEFSGSYGANYLPSTFLIFAIWNLPLKLLALLPGSWGDWPIYFGIWNKLLTTIVFFICAYLIYQIGKDVLKFEKLKAKITVLIFISSPIAFYCQFIFSQYDIFTVFFMLLGLYYYFKIEKYPESEKWFIFWFGIATTFKYFALVYFFVLLLLKEKKIINIFKQSMFCLLPLLFSGGLYYIIDRQSFIKSILHFFVFEKATGLGATAGTLTINYAVTGICVILAWAYFTEISSKWNQICYSFYFCGGISFVLFSFLDWHPQWLLMAVPFWCISFALNKKTDIFLWMDLLLGILFNVFIVNKYAEICDESLFRYGILSKWLRYKENSYINMADIYHIKDTALIFSIIVAILIIYFIFNHPKYMGVNKNISSGDMKTVIRLRFLIYLISFLVPAIICFKSMWNMPERLWESPGSSDWIAVGDSDLNYNNVNQTVILPEGRLERIDVYLATLGNSIESSHIDLTIKDKETGAIIGTSRVSGDEIRDCEKSKFEFYGIMIPEKKTYILDFDIYSSEKEPVLIMLKQDRKNVMSNIYTVVKEYAADVCKVNGSLQNGYHVKMTVFGFVEN